MEINSIESCQMLSLRSSPIDCSLSLAPYYLLFPVKPSILIYAVHSDNGGWYTIKIHSHFWNNSGYHTEVKKTASHFYPATVNFVSWNEWQQLTLKGEPCEMVLKMYLLGCCWWLWCHAERQRLKLHIPQKVSILIIWWFMWGHGNKGAG